MSLSSFNVPNVKKAVEAVVVFLQLQFFQRWFYPAVPGSPIGIQPPVVNTIQQSFNKQRVAKGKADVQSVATKTLPSEKMGFTNFGP